MFDWLSRQVGTGSAGLQKMRTEFGQMLDAGRHAFDTASNAFLGRTDLEVIREDLFATDKRINRAERQIRRQIVVHASVHGTTDFPACLVLMSIVKDAERVGDYAKNLFDLAELAPRGPEGEHRDCLISLKGRIFRLMASCREIFDSGEKEEATKLIVETKEIEDFCDEKVRALIRGTEPNAPSSWNLWQSVQPNVSTSNFRPSPMILASLASRCFCAGNSASAETAAITFSRLFFSSASRSPRMSLTKPAIVPPRNFVPPK